MTDPRTLSIKDFTYSLPEERIAKYPLAERDASKLLIYKEEKLRRYLQEYCWSYSIKLITCF
jgi:S-adenosylmethionine:tRNA-ribosyltransferase-isomerase (queuine synthetase)